MKYEHLKRTEVKSGDTKDMPDIYEDLSRVMNCYYATKRNERELEEREM
jgi:hypothetical protein